MIENINQKISVVSYYDPQKGQTLPYGFKWQGRSYKIRQLGYHHTIQNKGNLCHIFSVTDGNMAFRLNLNTRNLSWTLEQISDGSTN